MKIALIVAMGKDREIGKDNDLIWHLPKDMKFFKETTTQHIVLMGRKNWESIPEKYRPLVNRENVVLTRNENYKTEGAAIFNSLEKAIETYNSKSEKRTLFVIGGAEIYKLALENKLIDEMYITHIDEAFDADAFFPEIDYSNWQSETILEHQKDEKNKYNFKINRYFK